MRAPTLPGLALPQSAAHTLVGAAVLLFAAAPTLAPTTPAAAARPTRSDRAALARHRRPVAGATLAHCTPARRAAQYGGSQPAPRGDDPAHRRRGGVAVEHRPRPPRRPHPLRADRSPERARPERGPGPDPPRHHPDPARRAAPGTATTASPARYTVQRGDTLSGIAHDTLGDADRYPEILEASRDTTQPGGAHLVDPDVIDVGWTLTIPTPANLRPRRRPHRPTPARRHRPPPDTPRAARPATPPTTQRPGSDAARADTPPASSRPAATRPGAAHVPHSAGHQPPRGHPPRPATTTPARPPRPGWSPG